MLSHNQPDADDVHVVWSWGDQVQWLLEGGGCSCCTLACEVVYAYQFV